MRHISFFTNLSRGRLIKLKNEIEYEKFKRNKNSETLEQIWTPVLCLCKNYQVDSEINMASITLANLILKVVTAELRDKQQYNAEKKTWSKTGEKEMWYENVLVSNDEIPEKFIFNSKTDFRKLEGKIVDAILEIKYDNFNGKMRSPTLSNLVEAK